MSAALATAEPTPPPDPDRAGRLRPPPLGRLPPQRRRFRQEPGRRRAAARAEAGFPPLHHTVRHQLPAEHRPPHQRRHQTRPAARATRAATGRPPATTARPCPGCRCNARRLAGRRTAQAETNHGPARPNDDPHYAGWPSSAQLAADIRRRSVSAVLADICRALGITPHHPLWREARAAIIAHGGDAADLKHDAGERWCSTRWLAIPFTSPPVWDLVFWPAPWSDPVTAAAATATGPP